MTVRYLAAARDDLREAVRWYNAQRPGLGAELRAEVRAAVHRIGRYPRGWQRLDDDIRRCRSHRFPYGVIYLLRDDEAIIVAVAHLHREPTFWRSRLD